MEADCALVVEELESKPKERGQEGRLMWEGVAEEYRRSWSWVGFRRGEKNMFTIIKGRERERSKGGDGGGRGEIEK